MPPENDTDPDFAKYYPVSNKARVGELPEVTLKNISVAFLLLGLIAFMVNALMVFLFMRQEWAVIWPKTSAAQVGIIFMCFGAALYLVDRYLERKNF